ncbi:MAG: monofunctional biosynthetic peptidoglycan transglycosylase [Vicinamibacterales bacterium]
MKLKKGAILRGLVAAAAVAFAVVAYVYLTLPDVRVLATTNPTSTAFMRLRQAEAEREGRKLRHRHQWVRYSRISKNLQRAVLVAEDSRFFEHEGVDLEEIKKSIEINMERGGAIRGASTITQQLAKNLYLSPSKDPLRKLKELIIARRLEAALPKARILEIYLNVIEWGDGVWGAEAAARTYFGVPASALSREQAALLAGAIINPRVLNPARPNRRLLARQRIVLGRMGGVEPPAPVPIPAPADDETTDELEPSADPAVPPTEEVPAPPDEIPYTPVPAPADEA